MTTAEAPHPRAVLLPMMDLPAEFETETNLWFDFDHVPERLSTEGIIGCQRFELSPLLPAGVDPDQVWMKYLTFYDLASMDVLGTPGYALGRELNAGAGSVWRQSRETRERAVGARRPRALRTTWVERDPRRTTATPVRSTGPRVALVHLRTHAGDLDSAVNALVDDCLVPELLSLPGVLGVQRYDAAVDEIFAARSHNAGGLTQPAYMDVIDVATAEVPTSGPFRVFIDSLATLEPDVVSAWRPVGAGTYVQRPSPWELRLAGAEGGSR